MADPAVKASACASSGGWASTRGCPSSCGRQPRRCSTRARCRPVRRSSTWLRGRELRPGRGGGRQRRRLGPDAAPDRARPRAHRRGGRRYRVGRGGRRGPAVRGRAVRLHRLGLRRDVRAAPRVAPRRCSASRGPATPSAWRTGRPRVSAALFAMMAEYARRRSRRPADRDGAPEEAFGSASTASRARSSSTGAAAARAPSSVDALLSLLEATRRSAGRREGRRSAGALRRDARRCSSTWTSSNQAADGGPCRSSRVPAGRRAEARLPPPGSSSSTTARASRGGRGSPGAARFRAPWRRCSRRFAASPSS